MVTEEMKNAANNGSVLAIVKCIKGYNESSLTWTEEFVDEDTKEMIAVERFETEVMVPDDEEQNHIDELEQILLKNYKDYVISDLYLIVDNLDCYINTIPYIQELVNRGETKAMCLLADCYLYGDEENGIYKNSARAKEIYEQAAEKGCESAKESIQQITEWEDDEPDVNEIEYHITGKESSLKSIIHLIESCHEKFGVDGSAIKALYIPYKDLMQILVKSNEYLGNVMYYETKGEEVVITAECDTHSIKAFMFALYDNYPEINIELKNNRHYV